MVNYVTLFLNGHSVPTLALADALKGLTTAQFAKKFPDEDSCAAYLIAARWRTGVRRPRCDNGAVYELLAL